MLISFTIVNDGILSSYKLPVSLGDPSHLKDELHSLQFTNFSFTSSPSNSVHFPTSVSILALTSSHILLASTLPSQDIILHIWDVQLAVMLASYSLPIPSSLSSAPTLHLSLISDMDNFGREDSKINNPQQKVVLSSQAYLLISSLPLPVSGLKSCRQNEFTGAGVETNLTTVLFTISYTVPKVSTIAAAVGRGHVSGPFLKNSQSSPTWGSPTKQQIANEMGKDSLLAAIRDAIRDGRPQAAEMAFLNWASNLQGAGEDGVCSFIFSSMPLVDVSLS